MSVLVTRSAHERRNSKSNLPAEVTSFVGRRQQIAEVKGLLSRSRSVTLTGPGGVGKSRLALQVAGQLRRAFPDGVWLVSLADVGDPGLLAHSVAAAVGLQDYSTRGLMVTLLEFLSRKHLLLVLDNCEHLVDACAEFISAVLPVAPKLRILATSRQSLGTAGEQTWTVPPLGVPDLADRAELSDLPEGSHGRGQVPARVLARSEAVELFVKRAQGVCPGFAVTPDNGTAVVRICQRLDGIPLALELAAARLRVMSARQIVQRLDDRFRLLIVGNRSGVPRHQTLRALIDWSYDQCTEPERALWERASVFVGGFDLEAAEQVCAGDGIATDDVLGLVHALVDKSILSTDLLNSEVRYRMLETIRQYAHDRLAASGRQAAEVFRHRDYFQQVAQTVIREWFGPNQVALLARLRRERANFQAALEFCLTEPGQAQVGLTIATDLRFLFWCGNLSEGRRWYGRALRLAGEPTTARTAALWADAWTALEQGDTAAVDQRLHECRTLAEQLGDQSILATVATTIGLAALCDGDSASAATLVEQALAAHLALDDREWTARDQAMLSAAASMCGDIARAEEYLAACRAHGELWDRSWVLLYLSSAVRRRGDHQRATALAVECLRIKRDLDDRIGIGHILAQLACTVVVKHPERAAWLLGAAHETLQAIGARVYPFLHPDYDGCVDAVRAALGDKRSTALFEQGAALSLEEAIAEAISGKGARKASPASEAGQRDSSPLTRREREVAALVAEGLSNKDIAARLVISRRTAEGHIEHIMTKLGFTSRTQIAAVMTNTPEAL
jgi:predicted ATPase/DNA-binding CsgD family transcriptional regulator